MEQDSTVDSNDSDIDHENSKNIVKGFGIDYNKKMDLKYGTWNIGKVKVTGDVYKLVPGFQTMDKHSSLLSNPEVNTKPFLDWLISKTNLINRVLDERTLKIFVEDILQK